MESTRYLAAKEYYKSIGIDTEEAMQKLQNVPVSMHCWQLDDVTGFKDMGPLTGGIQMTGNYPYKPRNAEEFFADYEKVLSLVPGKHKLNIHSCYEYLPEGNTSERNALKPEEFQIWVDFAKKHNMGIDFNPTFFAHPMAKTQTLTSNDETVRKYWVEHGQACMRIANYFAEETGYPCVINFWIGDGLKDLPGDKFGPRERYAKSLDEILSVPYDKTKVFPVVEAKLFGIGVEAYTAGSSEFTLLYAATRNITPLMDAGHYHPTEVISDKISALLLFFENVALHVSRPIRWDSDHVTLFDTETQDIAKEIVRCNALDRVFISTDYFDPSINRVAGLALGSRSMQKALLNALLLPNEKMKKLQDEERFTELLSLQEESKLYPFGDVWREYCLRAGVPVEEEWLSDVMEYEKEVMSKRA